MVPLISFSTICSCFHFFFGSVLKLNFVEIQCWFLLIPTSKMLIWIVFPYCESYAAQQRVLLVMWWWKQWSHIDSRRFPHLGPYSYYLLEWCNMFNTCIDFRKLYLSDILLVRTRILGVIWNIKQWLHCTKSWGHGITTPARQLLFKLARYWRWQSNNR